MCGRLTLTTVVSSNCITALDITAIAIIQRFGGIACPSRDVRASAARAAAAHDPLAGATPAGRGIVRLATAARPLPRAEPFGLLDCERSDERRVPLNRYGSGPNSGNASCAHSQASELSRQLAQRPPQHVMGRLVEG